MSLLERCNGWLARIRSNSAEPTYDESVISDLADFVRSEIGRAADKSLEPMQPLVLYFKSSEDREEFLAAVFEAKPHMIARQWP